MTAHGGYQRVESDPTLSDSPRAALLRHDYENDAAASTYHHDELDWEYDELERHELEDRLGEIPDTFHRRHRRPVGRDLAVFACLRLSVPSPASISKFFILRPVRKISNWRSRNREALYGEEVTRAGLGRPEYSESNQLLHACDKSGHDEMEQSEETKDEDEEEETTGARKYAKLILPHVAPRSAHMCIYGTWRVNILQCRTATRNPNETATG
ncbi:unnamed protein product [Caenorhabditis auriculariae]|uniref:Uncharacterized protein n=1 Tax=Caenorhabditis auriculariae TaxID=2777116 RepID=A0A8S1I062_9PELO|nr:unnamed protein product [Caenorhabditis auriculariae]